MRLGVVSDTHSLEIPKQLLDDFKKIDLIIHAGDFCSADDLEIFSNLAPVEAVFGNMDDSSVRKKFPVRKIFPAEEMMIGITHGSGSRHQVLRSVIDEFKGDKLDIVIFGHSHQPTVQTINKVLYFNPGSPNDLINAPYCSYGIIEIDKNKIIPRIVKVK